MKYNLYWAPEGRIIATVEAANPRQARRKAPQPYRKYLGEIYVEPVECSKLPAGRIYAADSE